MSYQPIWDGRSGYGGKSRHRLRNVILVLLVLGVLCFAALEVCIYRSARTRVEGDPKVMVIFGCQVKPWGPSILLQDRLDTALDYLEDHPDMRIVVTGGKGDDEHISEAQCMYDYLTEHGVDGGNIYMEDRSRNTWQNVNYTRDILYEHPDNLAPNGQVLLVSNGFHLERIQMLWHRATAPQAGSGVVYSFRSVSTLAAPVSHTPSAIQMFFREPLALVKSFVFDRF